MIIFFLINGVFYIMEVISSSKAEECLSFLKKKNKCVILVSNSSRPTKFSIKNLDKLGIAIICMIIVLLVGK